MKHFPRGIWAPKDTSLASASWMEQGELESSINRNPTLPGALSLGPASFMLGRSPYGQKFVGSNDDRHIVTVAGSRAGKGRDVIIPNLLHYRGSVLCVDPKGENFQVSAAFRGYGEPNMPSLGQDVRVLDPFNICNAPIEYRGTFNPLDLIDIRQDDAVDLADLIADAVVIPGDSKDAHWDESARAWIQAIILLVSTDVIFRRFRNLITVKQLIDGTVPVQRFLHLHDRRPDDEDSDMPRLFALMEYMLDGGLSDPARMSANEAAIWAVIGAAAQNISGMADSERGSVFSTVARNLKFLQSPNIQKSLTGGAPVNLDALKRNASGMSLYLVLPQRYMTTHARWLRLVISLTVARMEAIPGPPAAGAPVLAMLDEFNVLGYMKVIETSAGFMAGFGLKLHVVLQDLSQLKRHYKETWETFLGNAGTLIAFGNADLTTLEHLSKRLSETVVDVIATQSSDTTTNTTNTPSAFDRHRAQAEFRSGDADEGMKAFSETSSEAVTNSVTPTKTPLMLPDEIARYFGRDPEIAGQAPMMLVSLAGRKPVAINRVHFHDDPAFTGRYKKPSGHGRS